MGRLFWKFFFFIWLAQLTTIAGISTTFWLERSAREQSWSAGIDGPRASARPGVPGARQGPGGPDDRPAHAGPPPREDSVTPGAHAPGPPPGRGGPRPGPSMPLVPLVAALLASLLFAGLLAWYFSTPIRSLRAALAAVAQGHLETQIGPRMGTRRDELADLGRDFDRMTAQLRMLMAGQRRLLHDVSHELRSPLARMQMAIGLLRQQPDKIEAALERLERETVSMDRLVGELLTLARLEAGVMGALDEAFELDDVLAGIADDAGFEAAASGRHFERQGRTRLRMRGRAELLHRAIENVVRNALKHAPAGSAVQLVVTQHPDHVCLQVLDRGPGAPEAMLQTIFEPFCRGASPSDSDGHGLGLAIARRIIEAHGGSIRATNRSDGGLCVEITLPAQADRG